MSQLVLLFSGQGAQKVGMGKDFAESSPAVREMVSKADQALGFSISDIMFEGPDDELTKTSRCQPALYLHGLVALTLIRERLPKLTPLAAAGLSLGEFTAHAAAGTFSFEDGLRIVGKRGAFMEEACLATQGAMAALIGGEEDQVRGRGLAARRVRLLHHRHARCHHRRGHHPLLHAVQVLRHRLYPQELCL